MNFYWINERMEYLRSTLNNVRICMNHSIMQNVFCWVNVSLICLLWSVGQSVFLYHSTYLYCICVSCSYVCSCMCKFWFESIWIFPNPSLKLQYKTESCLVRLGSWQVDFIEWFELLYFEIDLVATCVAVCKGPQLPNGLMVMSYDFKPAWLWECWTRYC